MQIPAEIAVTEEIIPDKTCREQVRRDKNSRRPSPSVSFVSLDLNHSAFPQFDTIQPGIKSTKDKASRPKE